MHFGMQKHDTSAEIYCEACSQTGTPWTISLFACCSALYCDNCLQQHICNSKVLCDSFRTFQQGDSSSSSHRTPNSSRGNQQSLKNSFKMSKYTKWCSRCCLKEACVLCFDCKSTNYCSVCFKAVHSSSKMKFHSSEEISCDAFHKYKGASDKHPQAEKEDTTFKQSDSSITVFQFSKIKAMRKRNARQTEQYHKAQNKELQDSLMSNEDGVSFEPSLFLRELTSFGQRVECVRTEVELQLTSTQQQMNQLLKQLKEKISQIIERIRLKEMQLAKKIEEEYLKDLSLCQNFNLKVKSVENEIANAVHIDRQNCLTGMHTELLNKKLKGILEKVQELETGKSKTSVEKSTLTPFMLQDLLRIEKMVQSIQLVRPMARRISKSKLERSDSKALKNSQNFNDMKKSTSSIHKAKDQFTKSPKSPDINKSLKITSSDHLRQKSKTNDWRDTQEFVKEPSILSFPKFNEGNDEKLPEKTKRLLSFENIPSILSNELPSTITQDKFQAISNCAKPEGKSAKSNIYTPNQSHFNKISKATMKRLQQKVNSPAKDVVFSPRGLPVKMVQSYINKTGLKSKEKSIRTFKYTETSISLHRKK